MARLNGRSPRLTKPSGPYLRANGLPLTLNQVVPGSGKSAVFRQQSSYSTGWLRRARRSFTGLAHAAPASPMGKILATPDRLNQVGSGSGLEASPGTALLLLQGGYSALGSGPGKSSASVIWTGDTRRSSVWTNTERPSCP